MESGSAVLDYASVLAPRPQVPRWVRTGVCVCALAPLAFSLLAIPPKNGAIDYTRTHTLAEVREYSLDTLSFTFLDGVLLLLMVIAIVATTLISRRGVLLAVKGLVLLTPALYVGPFVVLLPVLAVVELPAALAGRADGEAWSEGMILFSTLGLWQLVWLLGAIGVILTTRRGVVSTILAAESAEIP